MTNEAVDNPGVDEPAGQADEQAEVTESQDFDQLPQWAQDHIRGLRKEAAGYRSERNELRPFAEKYRELEEAKKSELEKAQDRIAKLEGEREAATAKLVKAQVASELGVPADLLPDGDEETVREFATRLQSWGSGESKRAVPKVDSVGRDGGDDKDGFARKILGI